MRGREWDQRRACQRGCGPHRGRSDHLKPGSKRFGGTACSGRYPRAHGRMTDRDGRGNDQRPGLRRSGAYERIRASGSVNRLLGPESVRHMSVTTATQGLTAAHRETQRNNSKKARETGKTQLTGRFRRWWQVLGSNQRRLSRRFYSPILLFESSGADQRMRAWRLVSGLRPSARCPCARGRGPGDARTGTDGAGRRLRLHAASGSWGLWPAIFQAA